MPSPVACGGFTAVWLEGQSPGTSPCIFSSAADNNNSAPGHIPKDPKLDIAHGKIVHRDPRVDTIDSCRSAGKIWWRHVLHKNCFDCKNVVFSCYTAAAVPNEVPRQTRPTATHDTRTRAPTEDESKPVYASKFYVGDMSESSVYCQVGVSRWSTCCPFEIQVACAL